ncbi:MAG: TetR/AcrR family transcriptional regulator, partial [Planctomycetota bacterium]
MANTAGGGVEGSEKPGKRKPKGKAKPKGRGKGKQRGRPTRAEPKEPRSPLTRERILEEALAIADAETLAKLTIRRLADALGVTPMAVYWHFESKDRILGHLVDHVVGLSNILDHETEGWREWAHVTFLRMRDGLLLH